MRAIYNSFFVCSLFATYIGEILFGYYISKKEKKVLVSTDMSCLLAILAECLSGSPPFTVDKIIAIIDSFLT